MLFSVVWRLTSVCLSRTFGPNLRTERPRKIKIGTVKRSKVNLLLMSLKIVRQDEKLYSIDPLCVYTQNVSVHNFRHRSGQKCNVVLSCYDAKRTRSHATCISANVGILYETKWMYKTVFHWRMSSNGFSAVELQSNRSRIWEYRH